jgi:putative tryptophan/tyrosine transport system substrate-binding protein
VKACPTALTAAHDGPRRVLFGSSTETIPTIALPVVRSLARPGGNTTGVSVLAPELNGKRQEILMEAVPGARRIAVLADPIITEPAHLQALQNAARARGVEVAVFTV